MRPSIRDQPVVAVVTRMFAPDAGAAAYRLSALVRQLAADGARVEVLTTRPAPGRGTWVAPPGVRVRRWPVLRDASGSVRGYLQYASFDVPVLARLLLARRPAVVVVEPPPTTGAVVALVAALRRVSFAYYAADVLSVAAAGIGVPRPVVAALRAVEGGVLRRAALVLTVSDAVAGHLRSMGVPAERVAVVGTGVDTCVFTPDAEAEPAAHPLAVYAGTMSEIQGAEVFVRALTVARRRHPDARLVMAGSGSEEPRLRALAAAAAPGAVDFVGVAGGSEVARWLRAADVGLASIHPGRRYDFAYATKMFASTACGTPVVYAGPGPCAELVREHRLGSAVPWDPEAVGAAMADAFDTRPTTQERQRLAQWTRSHYSLDAVAGRASAAVLAVAGAISPRPAAPDGRRAAGRRCPAPPGGPPAS